MDDSHAGLPEDIDALRAALVAARAEVAIVRAQQSDDQAMITHLKLQIEKLNRDRYGPRSERTARLLDQLEVTLEELETAATEDELAAEMAAAKTTKVASFTRKRPSRQAFPTHLPRERVIVPGPVACACCGGARLSKLGEDVTETLEVIPKSWKVIQHVREKFTCRDCEKISQAPAPFHVIARGWAGPSLLAMVLFEKFGQHQPLNRQADRHAFLSVALSLSVERLMLAKLLEQHHRQQAGSGPAPRDHVERRRRLADLLAIPAGELLPDVLDHLPGFWDDLQRLGNVFAEPGQPRSATAVACHRSGHDYPFARQMIRERLAGRSLARERRHGGGCVRGFGRRDFGGKLVLGRRGLQFLQRQFQLVQKSRGTLRARAMTVTVQLLDLQLQMSDQRLVVGLLSTRRGGLRARDNQGRFQRFDVVWQGFNTSCHEADGITKSAICGDFFSYPRAFLSLARALRSPGMLRISPVDRFQQITHLGRTQRHHAIYRRRPDKPSTVEPFGVQRQPDAVMPQGFNQRTRATAEYEDVARERIAAEALLHQQRQAIHPFPHVGVAAGNPDPHTSRDRDHRRSRIASTRASAAASTPASTIMRRSFPISITMRPVVDALHSAATASPVATTARAKPACCMPASIGSARKTRRHDISNDRDIPWRLAVDEIARGVSKLSNTIRSFSSSDQRRRRPVSTTSNRSA